MRGKSCKMIGKILGLSPRTVESYIDHIKLKFGCKLKSEVTGRAIEMGYLYELPASLLDNQLVDALKTE